MKSAKFLHACHLALANTILIFVLTIPFAVFAEDPALDSKSQKVAPTAFAAAKPKPVLYWGAGDGKSYLIPALDILGEEFLLNQYDRHFIDREVYGSNFSTAKHNLTHKWIVDSDPFATNQFLHPYQGSIYHGFARSAGLDYWDSLGYTMMGSALWEIAGETGPASINDQFTTGFGGSFLGEPLFRMASLLLESGGEPGLWREIGAAFISPATGFNRHAYGDRFAAVFRSNDPAVFTRIQLGVNLNASVNSNGQPYKQSEATADFTLAYGLPGKPGYTYARPFDYFHFQFTATTGNVFENVISRGLLYGKDYAIGDNYRGLWGLYGTYDYISPQIFRVSTTGAGLGTTAQWWLTRDIAYQGTALASAGYGSSGTIRAVGERNYHNGATPQGLIASRFIFSDRAALDIEVRDYYVSGVASSGDGGAENIARGDVSLTVRVYNLYGIALKYAWTQRDAKYSNLADSHQNVGAISIAYSYLGQSRFGAVDWRPQSAGGP